LKSDANVDCSELLRSELQASSSSEDKVAIYDMLSGELQSQDRFPEAEAAIRERIGLDPESPDAWINVALHFHYYAKEPQKALSAIEIAVKKARHEGAFVRQAHLERIRIALPVKAYLLVEDSLRELVNYVPKQGVIDVRLEFEFLDRIPKGAVSESLVEDYRAKVGAELHKQ
jgi:tetratricopeptide (TPR) repeat protein